MTGSSAAAIRFERFDLRPAQRRLLADGVPLNLGSRAFDLLLVLVERCDRVIGHEELLRLVWPGLVVDENNLRQQVSALRKLLGAAAVVTLAGRGYRFGFELKTDGAAAPIVPGADGPWVNNLPQNKSLLIGRETELEALTALLVDTHLLTLVGAGGVGKTRMALEVADALCHRFPDGVCLVELAPLTDPERVVRAVADVLDVPDEAGRPLLAAVLDFLRSRSLLIILDNCEHLIECCAHFAEQVLRSSAGSRTLATSREALGVAGEVAWRLSALRTAKPQQGPSPEALLAYPATRLFVQRAKEASPTFRLTPGNLAAVRQICYQLDGLPLALELAAARIGAIRAEQLADRLDDRFALLNRGRRTALQRHQTLRSLIDWSHALLSEPERMLLRRLAQFEGGWTLESAEQVCAAAPIGRGEVLDLLTHLVDKSMVVLDAQASQPRYHLLESIRQYGLEKLRLAGEQADTRARHLDYFVCLAEWIRPMLSRAEPLCWHARAAAELDNFRLAFDGSLRTQRAELGLRLFNSLTRFWYENLHWMEMVSWQVRLADALRREGRPLSLHEARSF